MFELPTFDQIIKRIRSLHPNEVGLIAGLAFSPMFIAGLMGGVRPGIRLDPFKLSKYVHPKYFFGEGADDEEVEPHPRIARKERKKKKDEEGKSNMIKKSRYIDLVLKRALEKMADIQPYSKELIEYLQKYNPSQTGDSIKDSTVFYDDIFSGQQLRHGPPSFSDINRSKLMVASKQQQEQDKAQIPAVKGNNRTVEPQKDTPPGGADIVGGGDNKPPEYGITHSLVIKNKISDLPKELGGVPRETLTEETKSLVGGHILDSIDRYKASLEAKLKENVDQTKADAYKSNIRFVDDLGKAIRSRIDAIISPEYDPSKRVKAIAAYKNLVATLHEAGIDEMIRRYGRLGITDKQSLITAISDQDHAIHQVIPAQLAMKEYLDKTSTTAFWHELDPIHKVAVGAGVSLAGLALLSAITGGDSSVYGLLAIGGLLASGYGLTKGFTASPLSNPNVTAATPEIRARAGSNILAYGSSLLLLSSEDRERFDKLMQMMNDEERSVAKSAIDLASWVARSGNMPAIDIFGDLQYDLRETKFLSDIYDSFMKVLGFNVASTKAQAGGAANQQGIGSGAKQNSTEQKNTGSGQSQQQVTAGTPKNIQMPEKLSTAIRELGAKDLKEAIANINTRLKSNENSVLLNTWPGKSTVKKQLISLDNLLRDADVAVYIDQVARNDEELLNSMLSLASNLKSIIDKHYRNDQEIMGIFNSIISSPSYNNILKLDRSRRR